LDVSIRYSDREEASLQSQAVASARPTGAPGRGGADLPLWAAAESRVILAVGRANPSTGEVIILVARERGGWGCVVW